MIHGSCTFGAVLGIELGRLYSIGWERRNLNLEDTYDPNVDAMNINFQKSKYEVSEEIAEGIIIDITKD